MENIKELKITFIISILGIILLIINTFRFKDILSILANIFLMIILMLLVYGTYWRIQEMKKKGRNEK